MKLDKGRISFKFLKERSQLGEKEVPELIVERPPKIQIIDGREKLPQYTRVNHFNDLYDSLGSKQGWRYVGDFMAKGTVTTVAASQVIVPVVLFLPTGVQGPNLKLQRWPSGIGVYPVINFFSLGPTTATFTTQGVIDCIWFDILGNPIPLGEAPNNGFFSNGNTRVSPFPITDVGNLNWGSLSFTLNTGATVGSYNWQLGFSLAYLSPASKGYHEEILHGAQRVSEVSIER